MRLPIHLRLTQTLQNLTILGDTVEFELFGIAKFSYWLIPINLLTPVAKTRDQILNLYFGSPDFDVLYISCNDKVYRRKVKGANNFEKPVKPNNPRL
ncbi:MAG: hypothetical protein KBF45_08225 [Cyclobacteriaceae bacterium]|jgi:hypothetical protein|nr:hypothetical protein [Cyclobacteriaceae bacterium]